MESKACHRSGHGQMLYEGTACCVLLCVLLLRKQADTMQCSATMHVVVYLACTACTATGGLTCTRPGAIAAQPTLDQVQKLYEESKSWYNFWWVDTGVFMAEHACAAHAGPPLPTGLD